MTRRHLCDDPGHDEQRCGRGRDLRCLYENDEILVAHSVTDVPDGTREAVLEFHNLKDGKIIRTETGATLLSK